MCSRRCTKSVRRDLFSFAAILKTFLHLAKTSPGWLREVLGQERKMQRHHTVSKPEVGEIIELKNENEEAVVYGDLRPVQRSRLK